MGAAALVLFAHGSRDARWVDPVEALRLRCVERAPGVAVVTAFLEIMTPTLDAAVRELLVAGCDDVVVVPVFLGQGAHVREDLPRQVAALQQSLPQVSIRLAAAVGEVPSVIDAMSDYCIAQMHRPASGPSD